MPSIAESINSANPLQGPLKEGLDTLSASQQITFTLYVKLILPLDRYVFWVRSDLVSDMALGGAYSYSVPDGGGPPPAPVICVPGSLHYATQVKQNEDESIAVRSVTFTAESEVQDFNKVGPCVMYIGEFEGLRFAFNRRESFYQQAGLFHYTGDAVYPALASQLVDCLEDFDATNVVVSNSLPIWLALNKFMPMYPSFLVQENLEPPYASVHIPPDSTRAIGAAPFWDRTGTHSQLVREKVKITLYGLRNYNALDFQDYLFQNSLDNPSVWGLCNTPVMQDEKRTQSELTILAQKKVFELEINYYQVRARNIARQLILKCIPTFGFAD
jgi:hypothetical protein